jgi:hypothetical protein
MSETVENLKNLLAEYLSDLDLAQARMLGQLDQWRLDVAQPHPLNDLNPGSEENPAIAEWRTMVARRDELLKLAKSQGIVVSTLRELASRLDDPERSLTTSATRMKQKMEAIHYRSLSHWISCQKAWLHYSDLVQLIATGGRKSMSLGSTRSSAQGGVILDAKA